MQNKNKTAQKPSSFSNPLNNICVKYIAQPLIVSGLLLWTSYHFWPTTLELTVDSFLNNKKDAFAFLFLICYSLSCSYDNGNTIFKISKMMFPKSK